MVSSLDPSSTTSTSAAGSSARTSAMVFPIDSPSLKAGMMIRMRLPLVIAELPGVQLSEPGADEGDFLGQRAGLLFELADLPAEVGADEQQDDDAQEQHQAYAGRDAH